MLYEVSKSDDICGEISAGVKETNASEELLNKVRDLVFLDKTNSSVNEIDKQIEDILKIKGYKVDKVSIKFINIKCKY